MQLTLPPATVEERIDEDEQRFRELSSATLNYMHGYGVAWESWLRHHRGNLIFVANNEHDLFEAMRLSSRLNSIEGNIAKTGRRNERIRSELLSRAIDR